MRKLLKLYKWVLLPVRVRIHLYVLRKVWIEMVHQAESIERDYDLGFGFSQGYRTPKWARHQVRVVENGIRRTKRLL